jgi:hypothetical protein
MWLVFLVPSASTTTTAMYVSNIFHYTENPFRNIFAPSRQIFYIIFSYYKVTRDSSSIGSEVAIQVDSMELQQQHHQGAAEAIEQLEQLPEQPEGAVGGVEIYVPTGK